MPTTNIFETLRKRVQDSPAHKEYEKRAMYWFRDQSTELTRWQNRNKSVKYEKLEADKFTKQLVKTPQFGFFYFFLYDPLYGPSLPYYDRFPFVLVIDQQPGSFLGLNFHYLPYDLRARFFDALYLDHLEPGRNQLATKIPIDYWDMKGVSKYKAFKPCLHRYRIDQLMTPLLKVGAKEWDLALFLPVHRFAKATATEVWEDSRRMVQRRIRKTAPEKPAPRKAAPRKTRK